MGEIPLCNPVFISRILCASKTKTLHRLSKTEMFVGTSARPFIKRIVTVRAPFEEQQKSAKFIAEYMDKSGTDTIQKLHHHITFSYKDDVLRKQLVKYVEALEGYHPNPKPLQVMKWDRNQLLEYLRYIDRELSVDNVFNLVLSHIPTVTEPVRIKAFDIEANSGQITRAPGLSKLHLRSSDEEAEFAVEMSVAFKSNLLRNFVIDVDSNPLFVDANSCSRIRLPYVDSTILKMVTDFCKQQVAVETAISLPDSKVVEDNLSAIAAEFLNVDPKTLVDIISAADYMQMPVLLDLAIQKFAHLIEHSNAEEIRQLIDITYFCDAEEKEPLEWEKMKPVETDKIVKKLKQETSDQRFC